MHLLRKEGRRKKGQSPKDTIIVNSLSGLHVTHAPVQESRSDWKAISPHDINCNIFKWKSDEGKVKYQPGHIKYPEL